jgi:nucleoside-diphosphate-sugar epimerase
MRATSPRGGAARHLPSAGATPVLGDLVTGAGLDAALDGIEVVFHLAGVTKALRASDYQQGNVRATENLLQAMSSGAASLIHVSSLAAMGPSPDAGLLCEDAEPRPLTLYGKSKLQGEQAVLRSPVAARATLIRPPVVYGPRDVDVYQIFKAAASGALVRIGRPESYFSFIYVIDLVDALILAAQLPAAGKAYFISNPEPVSWSEFGATAGSTMVKKLRTYTLPFWAASLAGGFADLLSLMTRRPGIISRDKIIDARQRYWVCNPARAALDLGFHAQTSLREGVAATLEWYRQEQWLTY